MGFMFPAIFLSRFSLYALVRSCSICAFIHICGVVSRAAAHLKAISIVKPRRPTTMDEITPYVTPINRLPENRRK